MDRRFPETMITNSNPPKTGSKSAGEEEPEPKHHGGSHGNYMAYKNQKLQEQFTANAAVTRQSNLFQGVRIHVNGWTSPSHSELKQIMAVHGGRFENYYSRSTVTHIICTNLPDAKVKQFEKERSPTPVIRPEWIVKSIEAGKLLPITEFILWQLRGGPGQRTLQDAFAPAAAAAGGGEAVSEEPPQLPLTLTHQPALNERAQVTAADEPSTSNFKCQTQINNNINDELPPYDPAELAAAQIVAAQMRADCDNLKGPPKSSKDDPNFVESFYRASRLHFIGTWKARLETLMASSAAIEAPAPAPYTLGGGGGKRVILHLDMDCFFASVAEAGHPEFKGKPLAVCHSNSARGSGEVSSANYEARKYGVGASMFIAKAKELCPGIIVVPYEFDKYEIVSEKVYRILLKYTSAVQPVSCDEAFLDITGLGDPETIAANIRNDIFEATQCTASAGIGPNILLARIATRKAKPNGVFNLISLTSTGGNAAVLPFLAELSVEDLPGVGWSTKGKLEELGINTVADIHASSKSILQAELGTNAGALLWDFAHGRDARRVEGPKPRRSVGAEVNWGVRFETSEDPEKFVASLAGEVASRMQQGGVRGRTITLKLKRKKPGWKEPVKFLGCGACDSFSKSVTLASMTASAEDLEREGKVLLRMLRVPFDEIRGMGLAVTRLDTSGGGNTNTGGDAVDTAVTGAAVAAVAAAAVAAAGHGPSATPAGGIVEGSEPSDAGWDLDSDSDVLQHKNPQQHITSPSPSPSPSGRGTKRKSPGGGGGGGKQTSLLDMMPPPPPRTARLQEQQDAEEDEDNEVGERVLQPSARRELLAKYEGLSLTQIDAAELAALPYQLQRELVSKLPRTRQDTNGASNIGRSDGGVGITASGKQSAAAAPAASAEDARGNEAPGNVTSKAIEPLPAFSQLDRSVLDALPLQLRREVEAAYGMKRTIKAIDTTAAAAAGTGGGGGGGGHHRRPFYSPSKYAAGSSKIAQHDSKLRRIDAFVKLKDGPVPAPIFPSSSAAATRHVNNGGGNCNNWSNNSLNITLSQIDPGVLHELPRELQDEVLRQLQPFPSKSKKVGVGKAVEARTAAAEASIQRQQLEDLQAAQVEGASLDDAEENIETILQELEGVELPPAVEALVRLAITDGVGVTVAEVLEALSTAIEEINELDIDIDSQSSQRSQSTQSSQQQLFVFQKMVMAAVSRLGKRVISSDLEGTKKLLMRIKRIGKEYSSFSAVADAVIERLQNRVQRRYGWPLSLESIL
jgi:nucleotidyltransferase/DNA polymerase involved in DNA repair